jgi:LPS-assembly lipoprotein
MAGLLGGCFQPLYASRSLTGGSAVVDQLRSVDVAPIKATIGNLDGALAVELRNALIFELTGGGAANAPTHRLNVQFQALRQQVIVDITTSRPDVEQAGVNASFSLIEIASGKVVVTGQTFARVSYDSPGQEQRFARARGRKDAETRAMKVIAEDVRSRLASYFIAGT